MPDLLLELRSEEIPARMQRKAAGDLKKLVTDALVEAGLTYEGAREYWTPRRLTLDIRGLTARSADVREERKGPRTDANEKAIEGFLRAAGLSSISEAQVQSDPKKGEFYVAVISKPGREAPEIIADIMPAIIRDFPWPKPMRWANTASISGWPSRSLMTSSTWWATVSSWAKHRVLIWRRVRVSVRCTRPMVARRPPSAKKSQ